MKFQQNKFKKAYLITILVANNQAKLRQFSTVDSLDLTIFDKNKGDIRGKLCFNKI